MNLIVIALLLTHQGILQVLLSFSIMFMLKLIWMITEQWIIIIIRNESLAVKDKRFIGISASLVLGYEAGLKTYKTFERLFQ